MITAKMALVLFIFIFIFTVASLAYPYDIANARKLITGNHIRTSLLLIVMATYGKCWYVSTIMSWIKPKPGLNLNVPWNENDQ